MELNFIQNLSSEQKKALSDDPKIFEKVLSSQFKKNSLSLKSCLGIRTETVVLVDSIIQQRLILSA